MKYIFILGNNPELSIAEIKAVLPKIKPVASSRQFFVGEGEIDIQMTMTRLGGTIKIGRVIGEKIDKQKIIEEILNFKKQKEDYFVQPGRRHVDVSPSNKIKFGFSFYNFNEGDIRQCRFWGMTIKRELKKQGINSRLVTSREPVLSSVIVKKEKCLDFIVAPDLVGITEAAQDFEEYGQRDYGRPRSDSYSGMLPPKLAKMMLNLSSVSINDTILDPFCGSGTIISEAMAMGFTNLVGCDVSEKAVEDTRKNLEWLIKNEKCNPPAGGQNLNNQNYGLLVMDYGLQFNIFQCDVRELSKKIQSQSINAIITEPDLGPPMRGKETESEIQKIIAELSDLYLAAFKEFKKVLKPNGRVVMVFPEWHLAGKIYQLDIFEPIEKLGFKRVDEGNLIYKREGQRVWRRIIILV